MSWQAYVDTSLVGTGHIDKAAIISAAGDSTWASTSGFTVKTDEAQKLVAILNNTGGAVATAQAEGFYVAGERFVVLSLTDRSVYGRQGRTGVVVTKTKQAVLVGHYPENVQAGNATQTVEALADYLVNLGY
ncbi:Profilin/allergen [Thozetella sp. PMI_491]|nr:Profilin/allergen [Thozetella sp. PMI_491]